LTAEGANKEKIELLNALAKMQTEEEYLAAIAQSKVTEITKLRLKELIA
jgi:hypothetical protein